MNERVQGVLIYRCFGLDTDASTNLIAGVDQLTGEQLWELGGTVTTQPMFVTADSMVFLHAPGTVVSIDARTGAPGWSIETAAPVLEVAAVDGAVVVFTSEAVTRWD